MLVATLVQAIDPTNPPIDDLDRMVRLIKPTWAESGWSSIPWMIDLDKARQKAAKEGKPLYVWSMSGEPLGQC